MNKFIFFLCFTLLGCSVESNAIQDSPTVVEHEPSVTEHSIGKSCNSEPLLEMYEYFVELGIKSANLTTKKASITFEKIKTPEIEIKSMLASEFGEKFLRNTCSFDGSIFSIDDVRNNYVGAYQVTFNSKKDANEAAHILRELNRRNFQTKKVATLFEWKTIGTTILITYSGPAVIEYYEENVLEFSK